MISLFSRKATYGLEARKSCSKELIRMNSYESGSGAILGKMIIDSLDDRIKNLIIEHKITGFFPKIDTIFMEEFTKILIDNI